MGHQRSKRSQSPPLSGWSGDGYCNESWLVAPIRQEFKGCPGTGVQLVIRVPQRDQLRAFVRESGVDTHIYYPLPLHLQECFKDLGYKKGDFPHAEAAADGSLALPMYPELTEAQQRYVVSVLSEFYKR
ncbi:MAG: DegT/DnrJ/EryC1/StrS family aminotransferase [candidate division NC10 bacterium]|nr:DegT/DnrJ/EryC1/StrS family aminotransferase [candidate division NC10 bacterium]MDE2321502.1 DegT/DnrJ/EryC1/StrS family aminotransferase [candidate division NC10 bacterium]